MAPSGVGVGKYTAMECGKEHGLGELSEERGEGDYRHFRGVSAAIYANSGEALYRLGKVGFGWTVWITHAQCRR